MSLLQSLENGTQLPCVKNVSLTENLSTDSKILFEKFTVGAYRAQRNIIKENDPTGIMSRAAARQARKMLNMQGPLVVNPDLKQIKDLAIKKWNECFRECLSRIKVEEATAYEEAYKIVQRILGSKIKRAAADTANQVLDLGHETDSTMISTATSKYRVVAYRFRCNTYAVIENPNRTVEVYFSEVAK